MDISRNSKRQEVLLLQVILLAQITPAAVEMANATGILAFGANTIIGTSQANTFDVADRNVIAGSFAFYVNFDACIVTEGNPTSIKGNLIGLDKTGTKVLGNSAVGIIVE